MSTILNKPTLADVLCDLLNSKGLSVSELARHINMPQPTVQRIASGTHSKPHLKTLSALANYFSINLDQLRGFEPIPWLSNQRKLNVLQIPILDLKQAVSWPNAAITTAESIVIDIKTSPHAYALKMPDASMEPLAPKWSILVVDPERTPQYRSIVVVKIKNNAQVSIRQLIIDAKNCYIKALSQDFKQFQMALLEPGDSILGVVVEVRLHCEEV